MVVSNGPFPLTEAACVSKDAQTATVQCLSPESRDPDLLGGWTYVCLVQSGQGPEVVAHITAPQSKSSQEICDAQWKGWLSWAEQNQEDPVHPSLPNYHRSMLASALKFHME